MQLQYFSLQSSTQTQPNFFSNDNALSSSIFGQATSFRVSNSSEHLLRQLDSPVSFFRAAIFRAATFQSDFFFFGRTSFLEQSLFLSTIFSFFKKKHNRLAAFSEKNRLFRAATFSEQPLFWRTSYLFNKATSLQTGIFQCSYFFQKAAFWKQLIFQNINILQQLFFLGKLLYQSDCLFKRASFSQHIFVEVLFPDTLPLHTYFSYLSQKNPTIML